MKCEVNNLILITLRCLCLLVLVASLCNKQRNKAIQPCHLASRRLVFINAVTMLAAGAAVAMSQQ